MRYFEAVSVAFENVHVVAVIQVKVAEASRVIRHLYVKEHSVTDPHPCKPNGRTLLVLNVPPYVTEVNHATNFHLLVIV